MSCINSPIRRLTHAKRDDLIKRIQVQLLTIEQDVSALQMSARLPPIPPIQTLIRPRQHGIFKVISSHRRSRKPKHRLPSDQLSMSMTIISLSAAMEIDGRKTLCVRYPRRIGRKQVDKDQVQKTRAPRRRSPCL